MEPIENDAVISGAHFDAEVENFLRNTRTIESAIRRLEDGVASHLVNERGFQREALTTTRIPLSETDPRINSSAAIGFRISFLDSRGTNGNQSTFKAAVDWLFALHGADIVITCGENRATYSVDSAEELLEAKRYLASTTARLFATALRALVTRSELPPEVSSASFALRLAETR